MCMYIYVRWKRQIENNKGDGEEGGRLGSVMK